jgi:methylated-DNA-[protein]-cysteine S-methyltransferase
MTTFKKKVLRIVAKIPKGKVMTYKQVASLAGAPRAYRAVGNILNKSASWRTKIPCHRVIRSDGKVGGYRRGVRKKIEILIKEGVL